MTQEGRHSAPLVECVQARRRLCRQIRTTYTLRRDEERNLVANWLILNCQEKPLVREQVPVPQTDTGRWDEKSKARERTFVKELGKITP